MRFTSPRMYQLLILVFVLCAVIIGRLIELEILEYKRFTTLSLQNQMSVIPIPPPRGIILDRNGVVLADNMPVYVLELIPEHVKNIPDTLKRLQKLLKSISSEDIDLFYRLKRQNRAHMPTPIKVNLSEEDIAKFAVNQYRFEGVSMQAQSLRYYPLGEETAHLLGYVGRINLEELKQLPEKDYRGTAFIGKTGIERYYESILHGKNGYEQIETDVNGRVVRHIQKVPPLVGKTLTLTVDAKLQQVAYEALEDNHGAVILMQPQTGEILALVSRPGFNPNHFVSGISAKEYQDLSNTIDRPLFNRAVRGLYPPASTLKPYVALIGLNAGVIDEHTTIYDPGFYKLPHADHIYHDWYKPGHGTVNVTRAITVSCDPFFYNLGHLLGIETMHDMLVQFGLGQLTAVDLLEETAGIIPNAAWKRQTKGVTWYPGDSLISAIGQGFMLVSPLQMAVAVSTLSQKGVRMRPHLLHAVTFSDNTRKYYQPIQEHTITLNNPAHWQLIHDAMHAVTTSPEGTGYRFGRNPPYPVAAKTGTAQVFGGKVYQQRKNEKLPKHLKDNSLFIAFAPVENPEVAIVVVVEHDVLASSVARKVLDAYFQGKTT